MNKEDDTIKFESGDAVETFFSGRQFKKVPKEGEEPCIFAYTKACDFIHGNGTCTCKDYMWAEDTEALGHTEPGTRKRVKKSIQPLIRCRHCGNFGDDMQDVGVGEGRTESWCATCRKAEAKVCGKCGKVHASYLLFKVEGGSAGEATWCEACCTAYAVKCPRCGNYVLASLAKEVSTLSPEGAPATERWCRSCTSRLTVVCGDCGGPADSRYNGTLDGTALCPACMTRRGTSRCSVCGALTTNAPNSRGRATCDRCRADGHGSPIYTYHGFGGSPVFWAAGDVKSNSDAGALYLGFELEAGGTTSSKSLAAAEAVHALDPGEARFHLEHDGSIPESGFELISNPHTLDAHLAYDWKAVLKLMIKHGLRSHDLDGKCGLHVHVSKAFLSGPDMAKLDLFVLKNQSFWEKIARRSSSHYSQFVNKPVRQHGRSTESVGRYAAVNFCNAKTVEFRIFRGTLNIDSLRGTLSVVDGMCRWIKTRNSVQILNNAGETDKFYTWLKDNGANFAPAVAYIDKRNALSVEGEI